MNNAGDEVENNVEISFKLRYNRHHNVKIITISTGLAEVVMDLYITDITTVGGNSTSDKERFPRHVRFTCKRRVVGTRLRKSLQTRTGLSIP